MATIWACSFSTISAISKISAISTRTDRSRSGPPCPIDPRADRRDLPMRALARLVAVVAAPLLTVVTGFRRGVSDWVQALRAARDASVVGLPTMSSIAWLPLALLLFQLTESAIVLRDAVRMRFAGGRRVKR